MFGFAALGEVALAEIPGLTGPAPPPPPGPVLRRPSGKVLVIDNLPTFAMGNSPRVNESCSLVINVQGIAGKPILIFTAPNGTSHIGDPAVTYVGSNDVGQRYIPNFPAGGYVVYIFDIGELFEAGTWTVTVKSAGFNGSFPFVVVN